MNARPNPPSACPHCVIPLIAHDSVSAWQHIDSCEFQAASTTPPPKPPSILLEAEALTTGDRHDSYGDYSEEAPRVAVGWEVLRQAAGGVITDRLVPLMMIWLKLCREAHQPAKDNRRDGIGYFKLADDNQEKREGRL